MRRGGRVLWSLFCAAGLAILLYSAWQLFPMLLEDRETAQEYDALKEVAHAKAYEELASDEEVPRGEPSHAKAYEELASDEEVSQGEPSSEGSAKNPDAVTIARQRFPAVDFTTLMRRNADIVGWLYVQGTPIDYPVVQGADNDAYLHTGFDGANRQAGCLFLDAAAPSDFSQYNHPLYGHNMKDESMFGALKRFRDPEFAHADRYMILFTPSGDYALSPFSIYIAQASGDFHTPVTDAAEARDRAAGWIEKSEVDFEPSADAPPRVATLITCLSGASTQRVVLHAHMRPIVWT